MVINRNAYYREPAEICAIRAELHRLSQAATCIRVTAVKYGNGVFVGIHAVSDADEQMTTPWNYMLDITVDKPYESRSAATMKALFIHNDLIMWSSGKPTQGIVNDTVYPKPKMPPTRMASEL